MLPQSSTLKMDSQVTQQVQHGPPNQQTQHNSQTVQVS